MNESMADRQVAVLWDRDKYPVPKGISLENAIENIKVALRNYLKTNELNIHHFTSFESVKSSDGEGYAVFGGVKHQYVCCGKKPNRIVMSILQNIFCLVYDNNGPWILMLIADAGILSHLLNRLVQQGHIFINAVSSYQNGSNAAQIIWLWNDIAYRRSLPGPKKGASFRGWSSDNDMKQIGSNSSKREVFTLWDLENCSIGRHVGAEIVVDNILKVLDNEISGGVVKLSAFANLSNIRDNVKEACYKKGVELIDSPCTEKDSADISLISNLLFFVLKNPPPLTIVLISGDSDFFPILLNLKSFKYDIVNITSQQVSKPLSELGIVVLKWSDVSQGHLKSSSKDTSTSKINSGGLVSSSSRRSYQWMVQKSHNEERMTER